jgi:hypothetical protein
VRAGDGLRRWRDYGRLGDNDFRLQVRQGKEAVPGPNRSNRIKGTGSPLRPPRRDGIRVAVTCDLAVCVGWCGAMAAGVLPDALHLLRVQLGLLPAPRTALHRGKQRTGGDKPAS